MMRALTGFTLAAVVLAPGLAAAQPMLVPGRDVAVLYRVGGAAAAQIPGGAPNGVRLLWDATGQRLRAEPVGMPIYALADLGRRVGAVVFAGQGAFMEARLKGGSPQSLLAGRDAVFTQRGREHLLGLDCTGYAIHSAKIEGTGCVTADGVVLHAEGSVDGRPGSLVALTVQYGPLPASDFVPPQGYQRLSLPGMQ